MDPEDREVLEHRRPPVVDGFPIRVSPSSRRSLNRMQTDPNIQIHHRTGFASHPRAVADVTIRILKSVRIATFDVTIPKDGPVVCVIFENVDPLSSDCSFKGAR